MRNILKLLLVVLLLIIPVSKNFAQLYWPIEPQYRTTPPPIGKTIGDWNVPEFHEAIDIPASIGTRVFSINAGYVWYLVPPTGHDGEISIGDINTFEAWRYRHITDIPDPIVTAYTEWDEGGRQGLPSYVEANIEIGRVADFAPGHSVLDTFDHLHFEYNINNTQWRSV